MTGASGYIGSVITEFAIAEGYTVKGLSRSPTSDAKILALGATPVRGDLRTYDVLTEESAKADLVIHLADSILDDFTQEYSKVIATEYVDSS
jgi:nucleoside-diphosphate-sugar epimerase